MSAATGNNQFLTDMDIRIALRDLVPEANELLDDLEFSPEEIRSAQTLAVDKWNETPPIIASYDYTEFPYRYNLLKGTIANLLAIAAHHYRRNDLTYNIPGGAIAPKDKAREYDTVSARLQEEYTLWILQMKRALNISVGFGTIG